MLAKHILGGKLLAAGDTGEVCLQQVPTQVDPHVILQAVSAREGLAALVAPQEHRLSLADEIVGEEDG